MPQRDSKVDTAAARPGPRPLALHLAIVTLTWLGSRAAWPHWNSVSPLWSPGLRSRAEALLDGLETKAFAAALDRAVSERCRRFAAGIEAYRRHPYRRLRTGALPIWQEGSTRLLDYGEADRPGTAPVVLVVPSLINRAYILDLMPERSLLRSLAASGLHPLLIDWGAPGAIERGFSLTDYVSGRLEKALDLALARRDAPVLLVGYCMGGLLAMALALRRRQDLAGIACLATPWDFHAERAAQARLIGAGAAALEPLLRSRGELPVDAIQAMFAGVDPLQVARKFAGFAGMDADSPQARLFVAVEDWLNDGVPLAASVARECLADWYGANAPLRGEWRIAGEAVRADALDLPSLVVIPDHDRIVPPASALALAKAVPRAERLHPAAGHIGMVVGGNAPERLYRPLADWLLGIDPGHWPRRRRSGTRTRLSSGKAPSYSSSSQLRRIHRKE